MRDNVTARYGTGGRVACQLCLNRLRAELELALLPLQHSRPSVLIDTLAIKRGRRRR